jgi:hypothetical protein
LLTVGGILPAMPMLGTIVLRPNEFSQPDYALKLAAEVSHLVCGTIAADLELARW